MIKLLFLFLFNLSFNAHCFAGGMHIQKYYSNLFFQKNNLSDMYLYDKISRSSSDFSIWDRGELKIAVFIGNDDQGGENNKYKTLALLQILKEECFEGIFACGFQMLSQNVLSKGNIVIRFFVSNSHNANKLDSIFIKSFKQNDVVLYNGHSRKGGGPDFNNPHYIKGTKKIDYKRYLKRKDGVKLLKEMLKYSNSEKILGLFSCKSKTHFLNILKNKNLSLILTGDLIKSSSMEKVLFTALNHLLSFGELSLNDSILSTLSVREKLFKIN